MTYKASPDRYTKMKYNRCGRSGLKLPLLSLGLWHNFGDVDDLNNGREMLLHAFDKGITHFDLANNYGPPPGSAESNFGKIMRSVFHVFQFRQFLQANRFLHAVGGLSDAIENIVHKV